MLHKTGLPCLKHCLHICTSNLPSLGITFFIPLFPRAKHLGVWLTTVHVICSSAITPLLGLSDLPLVHSKLVWLKRLKGCHTVGLPDQDFLWAHLPQAHLDFFQCTTCPYCSGPCGLLLFFSNNNEVYTYLFCAIEWHRVAPMLLFQDSQSVLLLRLM